MKFCEDCRWFRYSFFIGKNCGQCTHHNAIIPSYNTDALISKKYAPYASTERSVTGNCGKSGSNFEPK